MRLWLVGVWLVALAACETAALEPDARPASCVGICAELAAVPGLSVVENRSPVPGYRLFLGTFTQLVDHRAPDGPTFEQRITILHRDEGAPTVLVTEGYFARVPPLGLAEPTALIDGNQINVEHRYFTPSRPDPTPWDDLDIWQAASDHHAVVAALRPIYGGAWLGTGGSKSGMAAVFHRRFFPDDVDGTVAYVAPIIRGAPDARFVDFVEVQVGDPACRQALRDFQRAALEHRASLEVRMSRLVDGDGRPLTFELLGRSHAFELAVLELPFLFWQYQSPAECQWIPPHDAPVENLEGFLDFVSGYRNYADAWVIRFAPYEHQLAHELGYAQIDEEYVADRLCYPGTFVPTTFLLDGMATTYDATAMMDIDAWVQTEGRGLLFVYGDHDPWTAGAFALGASVDSSAYVVAGGNHASNIGMLAPDDAAAATATIRRWARLPPGKAAAALDRSRLAPDERDPL